MSEDSTTPPLSVSSFLDTYDPVIRSAMQTYAGSNPSPVVYGRARVLATKAFKTYDPSRGTTMKSYLMTQLQPLTQFARQASAPFSVPDQVRRQLLQLTTTEQEFTEMNGRDPSDIELADKMGLSVARIRKIRRFAVPTVGAEQFGEGASDPAVSEASPMDAWMDYVYYDLDPIGRKIMEWKTGRYGHPVLPNVQIARRLRITPSAVTQRLAGIQARIDEFGQLPSL